MISTGSPSCLWSISANFIPVGCWEVLTSWNLGLSGCYHQFPTPIAIYCCSFSWPSVHLLHLLPYLILPLCFDSPLFFLPSSSYPLLPLIILFPLLSRTEAFTLWSSFLLSFMWSMSCIVSVPPSLPNIHLSVSTYEFSRLRILFISVPHFKNRVIWFSGV